MRALRFSRVGERLSMSECGVEAASENIYGAAFASVAGIDDELVVRGELHRGGPSVAVISLDGLLQTGTWQLSVAD
jgi:hypothetical protein